MSDKLLRIYELNYVYIWWTQPKIKIFNSFSKLKLQLNVVLKLSRAISETSNLNYTENLKWISLVTKSRDGFSMRGIIKFYGPKLNKVTESDLTAVFKEG